MCVGVCILSLCMCIVPLNRVCVGGCMCVHVCVTHLPYLRLADPTVICFGLQVQIYDK